MDSALEANGSHPLDEWTGATVPGDSTVHGKYVRLERLDPVRHGDDLWTALCGPDADPDQFRHVNHGPYKTRESFDELLRMRMERRYRTYAIVNNATGKAEGYSCYCGIHADEGTLEVGEHIGACMQRTVRSTESRFLLINNAFSLGFRRAELRTSAENVRAQKAFTRAGYEFEGLSKKKHVVKGRAVDALFYVIFAEEWRGFLKAAYEEWLSEENQVEGGQRKSLELCIRETRDRRRPLE